MSGDKQTPIRIALADDEPIFRQMLVLLLERLGHEVVCAAANGAELVDGGLDDTIDLAIVDLDMPIMDGLAAAEHAAKVGMPVILLSGHTDAEHVIMEREPIVARLCKPCRIEELRKAIECALQQYDQK